MTKTELRRKYKDLRATISLEQQEILSLEIANNALSLPIWEKMYYHLYLPIESKAEVNTEFLLHILQGKDKSVVVPKSDFITNTMSQILLQENTTIKISEFGIPEPVEGIEIPSQKIDVVFVPLLAFDTNGNRLGYGKGFYDRFLASCHEEAVFIGLSFFEPEDKLPVEDTDIPLHYCITPREVYDF